MENDPQKLAEQIANLFLQQRSESEARDFAALRRSVERIDERLVVIETVLSSSRQPSAASRQLSLHPSQEKFEIDDDFAPAETAGQFEAEKPCPFEPTGKPCDRCSMCDSRGF